MVENLAISGTEYPYRPLEEALEVATRLGVKNLELWIPHNFRFEELSRVEKELASRDLQAVVISTWTQLNLAGDVWPRQQLILQSIQAAKVLQARSVNTYFGGNAERTAEQAVNVYRENIMPCLEVAEKEGVLITLENEFELTGTDVTRHAEWVRRIADGVDSPYFRLNFDPCNFYFAGEEPYPYAYNLLKDRIGYIHLKDGMKHSPKLYEAPDEEFLWKDFSGEYICCPMGEGAVHYEALFQALQRDGYRGFLGLEPHVPVKRLFDVFRRSLDFIKLHLD